MQLAMIGLGRMGGNMVQRLLQGGHELVVYDQSAEAVKSHVGKGAKGAKDLADVARQLTPRRTVWVMVPARGPGDSTLQQPAPPPPQGDTLIHRGKPKFFEFPPRPRAPQ